ncbi:PBSX family phage terminase large subunit [Bartonella tamiae]|uniref:PBSX family phage terminase large subunit n=1 Tax=Bartonella tamiae TaxID=373638 RepID=UPI001FD8A19F|nr:PBSX family phage terminase large subunit [Bartonella tamiae]
MKQILQFATPRVFKPLLKPSRYKGAYGGRGSGKSHHFAEKTLAAALIAPMRIVCIREVQKSIRESVKRLLEDKIKQLGLGAHFDILDQQIRGKNGSLIIFQGMQDHTAESIKSLEGYDIAWVEEAQSLSARSLRLLRPTLRKEGSEIWFTWNPTNADDAVDAFCGKIIPHLTP